MCSGRVTIHLAEAFGFCWGVERAVSMAYETRQHFPNKKIWITNEIIHNPLVNENLEKKAINFLPMESNGDKDFSRISPNDVVILPAFGASAQELKVLTDIGCQIVDTTCPWVSRVWNRVAKYEQAQFTAIIHGKYNHHNNIILRKLILKHGYIVMREELKYIACKTSFPNYINYINIFINEELHSMIKSYETK